MRLHSVKTLTLQLERGQLDCVRFGRGGKTLALIPGLSLNGVRGFALPLAYMYRLFAREYTVYVFDKRADIPAGYAIRDMAGDLALAMRQLGLCSADVLGVSQGGMIAQYLAIDHPQLVRKMALGVTASRQNAAMEEAVNGWVAMAQAGEHKALVADMLEKTYSDAYRKRYRPLLPLLSQMAKKRDFGRFVALARACLTCNAYPELHKITCPTLVIGGRQDKIVTGEASAEIAEALGCELYLYDGLGHAAYEEAGDFNKRVYRFFLQ